MRRTLLASALVVAVLLGAGGALWYRNAHSGTVEGCTKALTGLIQAKFGQALAGVDLGKVDKPAECNGLSDAQMAEVGRKIMGDSATTQPASTTSTLQAQMDACAKGMTFIRGNNTLTIVHSACVGLTNDQISQAAVDYFGDEVMSAKVTAVP